MRALALTTIEVKCNHRQREINKRIWEKVPVITFTDEAQVAVNKYNTSEYLFTPVIFLIKPEYAEECVETIIEQGAYELRCTDELILDIVQKNIGHLIMSPDTLIIFD